MKDFFKGVRRHIGKLDAEHLREQYARLSEETISLETLFKTIAQGIVVLDEQGAIVKSNPAASTSSRVLRASVRRASRCSPAASAR